MKNDRKAQVVEFVMPQLKCYMTFFNYKIWFSLLIMCIDSYVSEQFLFLDMSAKYVEVLQIKKRTIVLRVLNTGLINCMEWFLLKT